MINIHIKVTKTVGKDTIGAEYFDRQSVLCHLKYINDFILRLIYEELDRKVWWKERGRNAVKDHRQESNPVSVVRTEP